MNQNLDQELSHLLRVLARSKSLIFRDDNNYPHNPFLLVKTALKFLKANGIQAPLEELITRHQVKSSTQKEHTVFNPATMNRLEKDLVLLEKVLGADYQFSGLINDFNALEEAISYLQSGCETSGQTLSEALLGQKRKDSKVIKELWQAFFAITPALYQHEEDRIGTLKSNTKNLTLGALMANKTLWFPQKVREFEEHRDAFVAHLKIHIEELLKIHFEHNNPLSNFIKLGLNNTQNWFNQCTKIVVAGKGKQDVFYIEKTNLIEAIFRANLPTVLDCSIESAPLFALAGTTHFRYDQDNTIEGYIYGTTITHKDKNGAKLPYLLVLTPNGRTFSSADVKILAQSVLGFENQLRKDKNLPVYAGIAIPNMEENSYLVNFSSCKKGMFDLYKLGHAPDGTIEFSNEWKEIEKQFPSHLYKSQVSQGLHLISQETLSEYLKKAKIEVKPNASVSQYQVASLQDISLFEKHLLLAVCQRQCESKASPVAEIASALGIDPKNRLHQYMDNLLNHGKYEKWSPRLWYNLLNSFKDDTILEKMLNFLPAEVRTKAISELYHLSTSREALGMKSFASRALDKDTLKLLCKKTLTDLTRARFTYKDEELKLAYAKLVPVMLAIDKTWASTLLNYRIEALLTNQESKFDDYKSASLLYLSAKKASYHTKEEINEPLLNGGNSLSIKKDLEEVLISKLQHSLNLLDEDEDKQEIELDFVQILSGFGKKALPALKIATQNPAWWVTLEALTTLLNIDLIDAIPTLRELLSHREHRVQQLAAQALASIGTDEIVAIAKKELASNSAEGRKMAAQILGNLGVEDTITELTNALKDSDHFVSTSAFEALAKLGIKALPALEEALVSEDYSTQKSAIQAIGRVGGEKSVAILKNQIAKGPDFIKEEAITALGEIGVIALPALREALFYGGETVQKAVVYALQNINSHEVFPLLEKALDSKGYRVSESAVKVLGAKNEAAIPVLLKALGNKNCYTPHVIDALGGFGVDARKAVPQLQKILMDDECHLKRCSAARALGKIGGITTIPTLIKALDDEICYVRTTVIRVLGGLEAKDATASLLLLLTDKEESVRVAAIQTLEELNVKETIPALKGALSDKEEDVRLNAVQALGNLKVVDAISLFEDILDSGNQRVEKVVLEALAKMENPIAIPLLLKILTTASSESSIASAVHILANLGAKDAIPTFLDYLQDDRWDVREAAAGALGRLKAKEAIPYLYCIVHDPNETAWHAAEQALYEIVQYKGPVNNLEESIYKQFGFKLPIATWLETKMDGLSDKNRNVEIVSPEYLASSEKTLKEITEYDYFYSPDFEL